jgi:hypothetical protein
MPSSSRNRWLLVAHLALVPMVIPATASAAPSASERTTARALFDEARRLMASGKHADACPKLEEAQRLDPGMGTQFNLADCYEHVGRTASAWSLFLDVAAAAKASAQGAREAEARKRAAALAPKLSRLTVTVSKEVDGLDVKRDGVALAKATWGTAVPLDPGTHTITASAPGRKAWSAKIDLAADGAAQTVTIPELAADAPIAPVAPVVAMTAPATASSPPPPVAIDTTTPAAPDAAQAEASSTRTIGFVVGGFGVAALGVGGYFGVQALSKGSDAKAACPTTSCTSAAGVGNSDDAHTAATIANIGISVGLVALGIGTYLVLRSPAQSKTGTTVRVAPKVDAHGGGLTMHATW